MANTLKIIIVAGILTATTLYFIFKNQPVASLPTISIANYGPHVSLQDAIEGIKSELNHAGYVEGQDIQYDIVDAGFEHTLIPQMLRKLLAAKPNVLVTIATPVTLAARQQHSQIPHVFSVVTDPVAINLLTDPNQPKTNLTGASDQQDLTGMLQMAMKIIPQLKTVGMLYSTGDANDQALFQLMQQATKRLNLILIAIPVESARDVPLRMQAFKGKVDMLYVGTSGPIQPTLPAIASNADIMLIPVFNADCNAVRDHQVLACYGVSYFNVGVNTAKIIEQIIAGQAISDIAPRYPTANDHQALLSGVKAKQLNLALPHSASNITIVEQ